MYFINSSQELNDYFVNYLEKYRIFIDKSAFLG